VEERAIGSELTGNKMMKIYLQELQEDLQRRVADLQGKFKLKTDLME